MAGTSPVGAYAMGAAVQDGEGPGSGRERGSRRASVAPAARSFGVVRPAPWRDWFDAPWHAGAVERAVRAVGRALAAEVEDRRFFLFLPVLFVAGAAAYFGAPREPWPMAGPLLSACCVVGAWIARSRVVAFHLLAALAMLAGGFATASLQVQRIAHPVLDRQIDGVRLAGFVEAAEQRARGSRITLRLTRFERDGVTQPERARISLATRAPPPIGAHVALRASLGPPPGPAYPGGFDFGRQAWFEGIGATGFALGRAIPEPASEPIPLWLAAAAWLAELRATIAERIHAALVPVGAGDAARASAGVASALVTGLRDGVPEAMEESMRISGLSHVLSISGLHMALVASGMFFLVRALLALSPDLALRYPIKLWAALPAVLAASFYLALSGAEVATQRAYVMTLIVLLGVMLGRPALTLRTLAVAALIVLGLTPWAVLDPGAQMSFAATLALIAAYGKWGGALAAAPTGPGWIRWLRMPLVYLAALTLTSLAAGLATAPFAAYHFQRLAPLSLLANLAAMPVVSFVVMPAGLGGALLIPIGWDEPAWRLMGWGIERMADISHAIASVPGADRDIPAFPLTSLGCAALALGALCLLRTWLRWSAPVLAGLAVMSATSLPRPDILVDREARTVAVRQGDGRLALMGDRDRRLAERFAVQQWLSMEGARADEARPDETTARQMRTTQMKEMDAEAERTAACDLLGCTLRTPEGEIIAFSRHRDSLEEDCRRAALLVTTEAPPRPCSAQVLRIDPSRQTAGLALFRNPPPPKPDGGNAGTPVARAEPAADWASSADALEAAARAREGNGEEDEEGIDAKAMGGTSTAEEPRAGASGGIIKVPTTSKPSWPVWRLVESRPAAGSRPWLPGWQSTSSERSEVLKR